MLWMVRKYFLIVSVLGFMLLWSKMAYADFVKGIYITESTAENKSYLSYLIENAKKVGINTFVVDLWAPSKLEAANLPLLKENGITYVARIVMYPGGGTQDQVASNAYRDEKYALVEDAVHYGAQAIQLDYIRFNTRQIPSPKNAEKINDIIAWFNAKLDAQKIPLEVDVFGISSFGPSEYIGQDIKVFAPNIDALCPMVYPSHYEPYKIHAVTPYETIANSLSAIRKQFAPNALPFKLYPYIEIYNYRYPMTEDQKIQYIQAELRAVNDSKADGWYVWNPRNHYDILFKVLAGS